MMRLFTMLTLSLLTFSSFAQKAVFQGQPIKSLAAPALDEQFNHWEVYQLDVRAFDDFVKNAGQSMEFQLQFGQFDWEIYLEPRDIRSPDYVLSVLTDKGVTHPQAGENVTFRGALQTDGSSLVALTIAREFVYGFVKTGDEFYFIEPLWYFKQDEPKDRFVVYAASEVKPKPGATCGYDEMMHHTPHGEEAAPQPQPGVEKMGCKEIDLAIASDKSMFNKYGSVFGVEIHNIGVMNNVQTNYDDEFNDELQFDIVEQFVVEPPANDPWTNSTNASVLLSDFTDWGPSGFSQIHDLGQLWTNRNFQGGTVGIAWLGAVCTSIRYHCLQDYTSNASQLRVLTAHEIGHNFNASHDPAGSPTIMAPAVNITNNWSNQSLNQINSYYPNRPCLTNCASLVPPIAFFSVNPGTGCTPLTVSFTDQSSNSPTSWSWSFPGGIPASSTQMNPVVTYNTPGSYTATLTVSNAAGSSTQTLTDVVVVETTPAPAFNFSQVGLTVIFTNLTIPGTSLFFWDFGDGNTSTEANPIHTYASDGFYDVTLTASNLCGNAPMTMVIPVFTQPQAAFTATPTTGCAGMTVAFTDLSTSNTITWAWSFPGGTPATSSEQNPVVTYNTPGVYDVTLSAINPAGTSTVTLTNYITVNTIPTPAFTFSVNGSTVTFANNSTNANTYQWDFGDGETSTQTNPVHTYTGNGDFTVTLTATNDCGPATQSQTVTIEVPPSASFSASATTGCTPFEVTFDNASTGASSFAWSFPGGSPNTSSAQNPTVTYNTPGTYDVTLIVSNSTGDDTLTLTDYITVLPQPVAGFTSNVNGLTASFTNTSTHATSYLWEFGDGETSTAANPTHTYAEDGTYTVTLSATNDCGTVTTTQTVTIVTPPTAGFSANVTTGCAPLTVQFSNQSSENATSFEWEFPGGNPGTSTAENPTVTYSTPGTYTVTLTVSNTAGNNTSTLTNFVVVNTLPDPGFNLNTNVFTVNFTNTTTNGTSYTWDFGDGGTSTDVNPVHTYTGDGTYTVTLTATNDCGSITYTQEVVITSMPQAGFSASETTGCAPFTVQFSDQSSSNTAEWAWSFPGGEPSSSTLQNPVVTYNLPGVYTVTLTASNALGENTMTETSFITVGDIPTAGFTSTANLLSVTFDNTSDNAASFEWNFGDGEMSTAENPTHEYAEDGAYTVTLTATNDCGSTTYTQEVVVVSMPVAAFTANTTAGCAPLTVQFSNESSENATSLQWQFPGGSPSNSNLENPTVTYAAAGTYTVTLTVSNAAGNSTSTQTDFIVVSTVPSANFTGSVNGLTVNFTNNTSNATSYEWDFGDGETSTEANPSHTYAQDGVYEVTLIATNGCGSVTLDGQFTIVTPPTAGFSAAQTSGCVPFTVQFSNESSDNAANFSWSFPGGSPATSSDPNPTVTYSAAGTYMVSLTVSNQAGDDTFELTDYISAGTTPSAAFTSEVNSDTVSFTNTSTNATSYLWEFGDGETSTEADAHHIYQEDGAYEVTLTATNDCGSVTVTEIVVIATQGPVAAFSAESASGCAPLTVVFENLSSSNAENFEWTFPGGEPATSTEMNPTVVYNTAGIFDVTLTAANGQGNNTFTEAGFVVVNDVPTASFTTTANQGEVIFTNNSANATSYFWDFGDGETSTEANPTHVYAATGEYTVSLKAENECGFSSASQVVQIVITGAGEIPGISEINIFPNPNSGRFTLAISGEPQAELELMFTNVIGQRLLNEKVEFRNGQLTREYFFGHLPSGVYIFQVKSGERALFKKLVIE